MPESQPRLSEHSTTEIARDVNDEGEQAEIGLLSDTTVHNNIRNAPMTNDSSDVSAEVQAPCSETIANRKDVASSPAEQMPDGRTSTPQSSTGSHGRPLMGQDSLGERAGNHLQSEERDDDQSQTITRVKGDAVAQHAHCSSIFEPLLPGAPYTNAGRRGPGNDKSFQGNGNGGEGLGFGVIDVADIGLKCPKMSQAFGNAKDTPPLTDPVDVDNSAMIELRSRNLDTQGLAAATSSRNLESMAKQAWDSCQATVPERVQTSTENTPQRPEHSKSPPKGLSRTSTHETAHSANANSSHGAAERSRGPSALRPSNLDQLQQNSRKTVEDLRAEFIKKARDSRMSPAPARYRPGDDSSSRWLPAIRSSGGSDGTSPSNHDQPQHNSRKTIENWKTAHFKTFKTASNTAPEGHSAKGESLSRWLPANRSAGGGDRARSSSVKETQGPVLEPVCTNCRQKKRKCDRKRPRCELLSIRRDLAAL